LGDLDLYWRIILKWILEEYDVKDWTGFIWIGTGLNGEFM
jgi:hypothetical protein